MPFELCTGEIMGLFSLFMIFPLLACSKGINKHRKHSYKNITKVSLHALFINLQTGRKNDRQADGSSTFIMPVTSKLNNLSKKIAKVSNFVNLFQNTKHVNWGLESSPGATIQFLRIIVGHGGRCRRKAA